MLSRTAAVTALLSVVVVTPALAQISNPISIENAKTNGVAPRAQWDFLPEFEDRDIAGYAYPFSVNRGATVSLRIRTTKQIQSLTIWRLGYYNGNGGCPAGC